MSNLSCLLDVFHVGEEFVNKVNKKRNILKKGVSFSFSNYGLFIENSLFKELNKRFVNPHDLKYFNKDTHDRWIYGYFSDNGGRHVLFSEVEEKYFILLKIPKYSLEITIPLNDSYDLFDHKELREKFPEDLRIKNEKLKVNISITSENIKMYDSQTISEETANDLAIKFLINHRYLKHVRFDNKNLSQLHEIVKEKISDTKILNLFNNYMTSKDVSLFLRI